MNNIHLQNVKLTHPHLVTSILQHQCQVNTSSSNNNLVHNDKIVLDTRKPPPPLDPDRMRMYPKIGNREIVGYGLKGKPEYFDSIMFPCPSIRWEADTSEIAQLRKKEKRDWKQLSIEEKKQLYRASFRQTFAEFRAPTGIWKYAVGWTLIALSGLLLVYDGWRRISYTFDKPDSMNDEKLKRQMQFHIAARQGPMSGISAKWNYETGTWTK